MDGMATHDTHPSVPGAARAATGGESAVQIRERQGGLVVVLPLSVLLPGDLSVRVLDGVLWVGPARKPARVSGHMIGWRVPLPPEAGSVPRRIRTGPGRIEVAIPWRARARKADAA